MFSKLFGSVGLKLGQYLRFLPLVLHHTSPLHLTCAQLEHVLQQCPAALPHRCQSSRATIW